MALSDEIEVFLAVVQTASISEAAKLLFISQSTVSYRLKLLEDELDCRLIDRSRGQGHCELTRDGQDFLLIAEKSRNIHQEIVRFKNDTKVSTLRIGSPESVACYLFDELLDQPSSKGQKVRVEYRLGDIDRIYPMLASGQLDVGYVVYFKKMDGLKIIPLYSERMVVCASKGIFEPGSLLDPQELNFNRFVQFNWTEAAMGNWIDHWGRGAQNHAFATNAPCMAVNYMKNHRSWSVMTESMARRLQNDYDMEIFDLTQPPPDRVCYRVEPTVVKSYRKEMVQHWNEQVRNFLETKDYLKLL